MEKEMEAQRQGFQIELEWVEQGFENKLEQVGGKLEKMELRSKMLENKVTTLRSPAARKPESPTNQSCDGIKQWQP